jgi:hypothetical protein
MGNVCVEIGEALATSWRRICLQGGAPRIFRSGAVQHRYIVSHVKRILQGLAVKVLDQSKLTYQSCFYAEVVPLYTVSRGFPCRVWKLREHDVRLRVRNMTGRATDFTIQEAACINMLCQITNAT